MSRLRPLLGLALAATLTALAQDEAAEPIAPVDADSRAAAAEEAATGSGAEAAIDREPSRCLSIARVRRTDVIDDSTVVFYAGRSTPYVNNLPRRCPGLARNGRFMYELRQGRLCADDWITVLERIGSSFSRGFTCRLGVFHTADEETVAILKQAAESGLATPTSTATPVELPEDSAPDGEPRAEPESADTEPVAPAPQ